MHLTRFRPLFTSVALLLIPGIAWAAEASGRSPIYDLVMKMVNFGILAGILFYFLRKPVAQGLADRRRDIQNALEEARQAKETAEAKFREYQEKVARLDDEVRKIQEDFREEGERQRDRIIAEAREAAEVIRKQAEAAGANEVKRARDALRTEAGDLAVQLAEELLAKAYSAEDQKKAVQETIQTVENLH